MSRTIYAEIIAYEDQIIHNCETNGIPDDGTISVLEHEFGIVRKTVHEIMNHFIAEPSLVDKYFGSAGT